MNLPGGFELFILLFILLFVALPIAGVIDAALTPDSVWADANQNKIVWIIVQIFLGLFGAIAYFVAVRPKLKPGAGIDREQPTTL
jgi:heme/copper-type cytochrome/quinol oxidase subunit 2